MRVKNPFKFDIEVEGEFFCGRKENIDNGVTMKDEELIKTYAVAVFMLALIEEYPAFERRGPLSVIFNKILKKHNYFLEQVKQLNSGKLKKVSKKCTLFTQATLIAKKVWQEEIDATKDASVITINGALKALYFKNSKNLERIYAITYDLMLPLNAIHDEKIGSLMQSVKTADRLLLRLDDRIKKLQ